MECTQNQQQRAGRAKNPYMKGREIAHEPTHQQFNQFPYLLQSKVLKWNDELIIMDSSERKTDSDWLKLKQSCEEWTRTGESRRVHHALSEIPNKEIPPKWRLPLANIARRGGLVLLGLRLLAPALKAEPSNEELAEYGVLLQKNGSVREALNTLEKIDTTEIPEALLYRSFCLFTRWEYAAARPLLEKYVASPALGDYQRTIGMVNLASALLMVQDFSGSTKLLQELIEICSSANYARLEGNCHELLAQVHLQKSEWLNAEAELAKAEKLLANDFSLDHFFVRKWKAVISALRNQDREPLDCLREEALELKHWESVREADLFLVKLTGDEELFQRVYFGTPHQSYRDRLRIECPKIEPREELILGSGDRVFDLTLGELDGETVFKSGKKIHQLICMLFLDLYRPQRLAHLFAELFPEENFNAFSSPNRIHQLTRRAREAVAHEGLPLTIEENAGTYSASLQAGLMVRLTGERKVTSSEHAHLIRLKLLYPDLQFSAREARMKLGVPLTTFNRVLKYGLESKLLSQHGNGPKTRYKAA